MKHNIIYLGLRIFLMMVVVQSAPLAQSLHVLPRAFYELETHKKPLKKHRLRQGRKRDKSPKIRKKRQKRAWSFGLLDLLISGIIGLLLIIVGLLLRAGTISLGWAGIIFTLLMLGLLIAGTILLNSDDILSGLSLLGTFATLSPTSGGGILLDLLVFTLPIISSSGFATFLILFGLALPFITLLMRFAVVMIANIFIGIANAIVTIINIFVMIFTLGFVPQAIEPIPFLEVFPD